MYVASPILKIKPQKGYSVPDKWNLGNEYRFRVSLFGMIPLGEHFINLVELNNEEKRIVSKEHGTLAKVWNHIIKLNPIDDHTIEYTDEVEIKAGVLTIPIWLIAHIFYRHRQNRWKKLFNS